MVGTRKTPGRAMVTLDGSPIIDAVDNEDDTTDINNQFFVGFYSPAYFSRLMS
jgi:hypothetical protein